MFYTQDWHPAAHTSFNTQGSGEWERHYIANSHGANLYEGLYKLENIAPNKDNCFKKGQDESLDEHSCFGTKNENGKVLYQEISALAQKLKQENKEAPALLLCGFISQMGADIALAKLRRAGVELVLG